MAKEEQKNHQFLIFHFNIYYLNTFRKMNFTHLLSPVQILLSLSFECATKISILFALVCLSKSDKTIGIEEQFSNIVFAIQYFPFL